MSAPKEPTRGTADGGYRGSGDWRSAAETAEAEVAALRWRVEEEERLHAAQAEARRLRRTLWERDHAAAVAFMRRCEEARQRLADGLHDTIANVAGAMDTSESAWKRERTKHHLDGWRPGMAEDWTPTDR